MQAVGQAARRVHALCRATRQRAGAHAVGDGRGGRGGRAYAAVAVFYTLLFFALIWPVYPRFATIEPRILAVPFSLAYVVGGLLVSFVVLLGVYLWDESRGANQPIGEDD